MVRFAPVISSAAVARAQANNQLNRAAKSKDLDSLRNAPGGRVRLPSLYPAVSLRSLHSRSGNGEQGIENDQATSTRFTGQSSLDNSEQDRTSVLRELSERNCCASPPRVRGTPLVVGAAGVLRAATAFAVDNKTAETTVQQAEEQIEEPECEVNNFRICISKFLYQRKIHS